MVSSLYRLLEVGKGLVGELRLVHLKRGSSGDQRRSGGPCRSEHRARLEHVPDGLGELAGYFDASDLGAALATKAGLGPVVVVLVDRMTRHVHSGPDESPAQVLRPVL